MRKTHILADATRRPSCGVPIYPDTRLVRISGALPHVECRRCLRHFAADLRRNLVEVERRLDGKDAAQRDAFDKAR
ncbi:MAG: hypothetical protein KAI41_06155 [Hyphomicrobiaceae bacterium]|nr:hypothetical protein [Hyphomicrobiaceae bacterium]